MTEKYTAADVLRIAKRLNNTKRAYLLVNPLQAKHIPVKPSTALEMMRTLGEKLSQSYPDTRLVIGFAETATAIGAAAAECFGGDCVYIHTTREWVNGVNSMVPFLEEHSHAAEQNLCADNLRGYIDNTKRVIFIDDELSTGKTLINIISIMREWYPAMRDKEIIAASIINRLSEENTARLEAAGIRPEYLVKLPCEDYAEYVKDIEVFPAEPIESGKKTEITRLSPTEFLNPRAGVNFAEYKQFCRKTAIGAAEKLAEEIPRGAKVLVLGTEECMYPALVLGEVLEGKLDGNIFCHSTTRSPVGISLKEEYPIRSGIRLRSFYEENRVTFIYNLARYDAAVIVSDSLECAAGLDDLASALAEYGTGKIFFLGGY